MKISLPKVPDKNFRKKAEIGELVMVLLRLYQDAYLDSKDIEVEYYESWSFYKVSIFRWSKAGAGCGTKEWRDRLWVQHQAAMMETFHMVMPPCGSWRWPEHMSHIYLPGQTLDIDDGKSVPGMTYMIKAEELCG